VSLNSIQAGTCTRDCCNRHRHRCRRRLAVTAAAAAAAVSVARRGGDNLPVTTCSRLSARARASAHHAVRNDGPCVSDDDRFLFFHFRFRRFLLEIASLTTTSRCFVATSLFGRSSSATGTREVSPPVDQTIYNIIQDD